MVNKPQISILSFVLSYIILDWKSGKQAVCRSKLVLALGNSFFVEKIQVSI